MSLSMKTNLGFGATNTMGLFAQSLQWAYIIHTYWRCITEYMSIPKITFAIVFIVMVLVWRLSKFLY